MNITIAVDGPLDVEATLARYRIWGEDPVNRLGEGVFHRALQHGATLVPYELRWRGPVDAVRLEIVAPRIGAVGLRAALVAEVRKLLGLDFDLAGFYRFAAGEPPLAALAGALYGLRPTLTPAPLEMLVTSIAAQQVNLAFAFACRARLVRRFGVPLPDHDLYAFPQAATLAVASIEELFALKFSTRKAEYIRDLARAVTGGAIDLDALPALSHDEAVRRITALRGLGRWTAEWFLARHAGRGDVCPAGDLAVRKAFDHHYGRGRRWTEVAIRRRAQRWGRHQNLAVHYLLAGMRRLRANSAAGG